MSFAAVLQKLKTLENPYPGLRPFEGEESHLFFGRDQQTGELIGRLERNHFVAVVGVSGSGKSSLVRAGLIPALQRAQLSEAGRRWRMVVTRPGSAPYERLAADLAAHGLDAARLKESSHGLIAVAGQLEADESLLVIVDQFEELFRYKELGPAGDDARQQHNQLAADAAEFVQLLLAAARHQPPVYIVLTMRSDYLGDCAEFRDLPETLNDCQYLVPRLTREQRKAAILGPLGRVDMEPALVQRLLNVTGDEPDQLPVLQHALMRTWSHWYRSDPDHTRRIELRDFDAIGGLTDALNRHAEELVSGTPQDITAMVFKRLTARGRSSRERRNPATLAELWAVCLADAADRRQQVNTVVDRFRQGEATFLVPRDGPLVADTYIDITHESLIRQWETLRDRWLPEEQAASKAFLDLIERARSWKDQGGPLLIGLNLRDAVDWERQRNPSAAWARYYASESALAIVLEFIRASEKQERDERLWRRRVRYSLIGALAVGVVGLVLAAVGQYQARVSAQRAADVARAGTYEAQILSVPSVPDPLTRALLLAELGPHAKPEHLVIYQQAAAAPIPMAVFRYSGPDRAIGGGFLADGRTAVARADGALLSWSSDGRGDSSMRALAAGASQASGSNVGATPRFNLAVFSDDGRWIAAGSADGVVWLARTAGAEKLRQLLVPDPAEPKEVYALAFSRDGRQLAVGFSNYTAEVVRIDAPSGRGTTAHPTHLTGGHFAPITSVDFNPDGTRLVTGALDGTLRVWNLREPTRPALALAGSDRAHDAVTCVAFSPDGAWILSGYDSGAVRIVRSDGTAAAEGPRLSGHTAPITSASFSPARDSYKVVTASADNTARIWTLQERIASGNGGRSILSSVGTAGVLTHDAPVTAVAFSTDGSRIVTTSDDGAARLWPSEQGEPRTVGLHRGRVESVAFNPDATRVLSASDDKTAQLWSAAGAGAIQKFGDHADWVRKAAFSPADLLKVVTADDSGTLRMWEMKAPGPARARLTQEGGTVFDAAFNRQGDRLVTAVGDKTARIWKTSALIDGASALDPHESTAPIEFHHEASVLGAAFSPDGSQIVTASQDGTVRIWRADRDQHAPVTTIAGGEAMAFKAAFSPDGTRVVTAYADGVARVWRTTAPGEPLLQLRHRQDVNEAVFSPSGHWIATASKDGTAKLWDALDGTERVAFQHGKEVVRAVAFDPTETRVVTGTGDGVVRVWRITVKGLRDYLEGATTACLPPSAHVRFLGESSAEGWNQYRACESRWGRTLAEPGVNTLTTGSPATRR